jgi:hypothetical protein
MATRTWTVWSEGHARAELALWKKSGQSLMGFASGRGYSESRLRWWRKQLGDVAPPPTALVPLHVVEPVRRAAVETSVEIALRGGRTVHVRSGFDATTLAAVVRTLEGAC